MHTNSPFNTWFAQTWQDLRYGVRSLGNHPWFSIMAVLALALGLGANTAVFSVFHSVLLRDLPYPESDQLVAVWEHNPATNDHNIVSAGNYLDWQEQNTAFESIGAFEWDGATLRDHGPPQPTRGARTTPSLLDVLQVDPVLGRGFMPGEDAGTETIEILISHSLWQTRFAGTDDILNTTVHLDDTLASIVGVMPASFDYPSPQTDFWRALRFDADDRESRRAHRFRVLARLAPGVNRIAAQAEMDVISQRIAQVHPEYMTGWGVDVEPYRADLVTSVRSQLVLLVGMAILVLLVACANVGNLLLVRATSRQRELAIRGALGAGRSRIARQLLTEAALIAFLGTAAGLFLAVWTFQFLDALRPDQLPDALAPRLNLAALGIAGLGMVGSTLLVGLAPAWWLGRTNPTALVQGGRTISGGHFLHRSRSVLLVTQLAVATLLLVGAGLLLRSMSNLQKVDYGFDPENLVTAQVGLPRTRYQTIADQAAFYAKLQERLASIPGVQEVAGTSDAPLSGGSTFSYVIEGRPRSGPNPREQPVEIRGITPNYFSTARIPLLQGRIFNQFDDEDSREVIIVNRAFTARHFPGETAVGHRISTNDQGGPWLEIVGEVADIKDSGLDQPSKPAIYIPYAKKRYIFLSLLTALMRTSGDPLLIKDQVEQAFFAVDPELPLSRFATVPQLYTESLARRTFITRLTAGFAVLTLSLGVIGVYGVIAFAVTQRRREFGICLALGATHQHIVGRVMNSGVKLVVIGLLVGLIAALYLGRFLETLLFEVQPIDAATLLSVATTLGIISVIALWLPARRAAKTNPVEALRAE